MKRKRWLILLIFAKQFKIGKRIIFLDHQSKTVRGGNLIDHNFRCPNHSPISSNVHHRNSSPSFIIDKKQLHICIVYFLMYRFAYIHIFACYFGNREEGRKKVKIMNLSALIISHDVKKKKLCKHDIAQERIITQWKAYCV